MAKPNFFPQSHCLLVTLIFYWISSLSQTYFYFLDRDIYRDKLKNITRKEFRVLVSD